MEEEETHIWPARAADAPSHGSASRTSLNEDPHNLRAEELAVEYCKQGAAVSREWSEGQMVCSFGGGEIPGTPDGMFEDAMGSLTCVQVVRVPLLPAMFADEVAETLYETVLTKVVKSQTWIRSTGIVPHNFVIFCWLPPVGAFGVCMVPSEAMVWTEALIWNVRAGGWPFSLKVLVPDEPDAMFPSSFGLHNERRVRKDFWSDLSFFFDPADFEDDDEPMDWDLFAYEEEPDGEADVMPMDDLIDEAVEVPLLEDQDDVEEPLWFAHFDPLGMDNAEKDRSLPSFPQMYVAGSERNGAQDRPPLQGLPWWGEFATRADRPPLQGLPWWGEFAIRADLSYYGIRHAIPITKHCKRSLRFLFTMGWLLLACAA